MPSFDVVSEVNMHEVTMTAPSEFQLGQMMDILTARFSGRKIDVRCLSPDTPQVNVNEARQEITVRHGIDADLARKIVKMIKAEKLKVQAAIQGDKVRVTGKKRDDLQQVIGMLKEAKVDVPLQYENYRD